MLENFLCRFENVLEDEHIDKLIKIADSSKNYTDNNFNTEHYRQDLQVVLEPFFPDLARWINEQLIHKTLINYIKKYPYISSLPKWTSSCTLLQKTTPSQGYHEWHCENLSYYETSRAVVWMIYLNDVEDGGETEFLYQRERVKPKRNTALLWPGSWTHIHRGNPPLKNDKYILTGWFTPFSGMRQVIIGDKNNET